MFIIFRNNSYEYVEVSSSSFENHSESIITNCFVHFRKKGSFIDLFEFHNNIYNYSFKYKFDYLYDNKHSFLMDFNQMLINQIINSWDLICL